jgi:hypothetical protein
MSWKNGVSVYRQTETDRNLNQGKEKVAEFKLATDADNFAWWQSEILPISTDSVFWTVEDRNLVIKRYEQVGRAEA